LPPAHDVVFAWHLFSLRSMFHSFQLHYSFKVVPTPQEKQCPGNAVQNAAMQRRPAGQSTECNEGQCSWLIQNVNILSDSFTISYKSCMVDRGQSSVPPEWRSFRHDPQASIFPPLSTKDCICSVTLNCSVFNFSQSTPLASRNTFI